MIERRGKYFEITCDICGTTAETDFDCFDDAVEYKKNHGWRSKNENGGWWDYCPDCQ